MEGVSDTVAVLHEWAPSHGKPNDNYEPRHVSERVARDINTSADSRCSARIESMTRSQERVAARKQQHTTQQECETWIHKTLDFVAEAAIALARHLLQIAPPLVADDAAPLGA